MFPSESSGPRVYTNMQSAIEGDKRTAKKIVCCSFFIAILALVIATLFGISVGLANDRSFGQRVANIKMRTRPYSGCNTQTGSCPIRGGLSSTYNQSCVASTVYIDTTVCYSMHISLRQSV